MGRSGSGEYERNTPCAYGRLTVLRDGMKVLVKEEIRGCWAGQWEGEEQWVRQTRAEHIGFFFFKCVSLSLSFCLQNRVLQHSRLLIHHQFLSTFRIQNGIVALNMGSFTIKELYLPEIS